MSGLGRAWVRTNVKNAKELLVELQDLTSEEKKYLNEIVEKGEAFLKLTVPDNSSEYSTERLPGRLQKCSRTCSQT